jgi:transposase
MVIISIDLRQRVIAAVKNGMHVDDAVKIFTVSRRVVYEWLELQRETGSLAPKTGYQKGHSHKIVDWNKFKEFANINRQCSGPQMVVKWKELMGVDMSDDVMYNALKKIGFTSKKKRLATSSLIKKNKEDL